MKCFVALSALLAVAVAEPQRLFAGGRFAAGVPAPYAAAHRYAANTFPLAHPEEYAFGPVAPVHPEAPLAAVRSAAPLVVPLDAVHHAPLPAFRAAAPLPAIRAEAPLAAVRAAAPLPAPLPAVHPEVPLAAVRAVPAVHPEAIHAAAPLPAIHPEAPLAAVRAVAPVPALHAEAPLAAPLAAPLPASGPVATQYHLQDEFGSYEYGYENINSAKRERGNVAAGVVEGEYSYVDAFGIPQHVTYVADALGFRAHGTNIPTNGAHLGAIGSGYHGLPYAHHF